MYSRRLFIQQFFLVPGLLVACKKNDLHLPDDLLNLPFDQKISFKQGCTLLFIGDSITDATRDKNITAPNDLNGLGKGYVKEVATTLFQKEQFENGAIYNRGIAGNQTIDLLNRWDKDVIELKPDVVSILIGVNDLRRHLNPKAFYDLYWKLLSQTRKALPDTSIILCEPFILPNIREYDNLNPDFTTYRKMVRKLAIEFNTFFVPNYSAFESSLKTTAASDLLYDGLHPTSAGIHLLKDTWLKICAFQ